MNKRRSFLQFKAKFVSFLEISLKSFKNNILYCVPEIVLLLSRKIADFTF